MRRRPSALAGGQQAGGFETVGNAQALAGLVDVLVDRILADSELAGDLLGRQMLVDEAQNLPLPRGQALDQVEGLVAYVCHHLVTLTTSAP